MERKMEKLNGLGFMAYGAEQYGTARAALLRFTIAAAIAVHFAELDGTQKVVKNGLVVALKNRGENEKTAYRHVGNAAKASAALMEKVQPDLSGSIADAVNNAIETLTAMGALNATDALRLCGVGSKDKESAADKAARMAADMAAAIDGTSSDGEASAGVMGAADTATAQDSQNEKIDPAALDLSSLDYKQLALLAQMVAAEMLARREASPTLRVAANG